ncbi:MULTISPECIES: hypothetical protein [unclassified Streptomyces]|uniref:hypothetical protein n=1 Tax=unclassified Streptomyces TaxID=2593676 RepID=UPI002E272D5B|nr:hypothetical protein OG296_38275 [Streptomyces sp. NBC_01001]
MASPPPQRRAGTGRCPFAGCGPGAGRPRSHQEPGRVVVAGISTQQIAGENAALDLMLAHLTHDAEAIVAA